MDFPAPYLFVLVGLTLTNWIAAALGKRKLYFATKPFVLLVLIIIYYRMGGLNPHQLPFFVALVLSLLGDILLIPRSTRWFIAGMVVFLFAHLAYTWAFSHWPVAQEAVVPAIIAGLAVLSCLIALVLIKTKNKSEFKLMRLAFILYGTALTTMLIAAFLCLWRPAWPKSSAILAALGGVFFFVSDSMIGLEKMGKHLPMTGLLVISTYHIAQMLIVLSSLGL